MYLYGRSSTGKSSLILEMLKMKKLKYAYINCLEYLEKVDNCFTSIQTQLISEENLSKKELIVDLLDFIEFIKSFCSFDETLYLVFDNVEKWKGIKNLIKTLIKIDEIVKKNY
jgi:Cdc6-like AAA superfamily ATPase